MTLRSARCFMIENNMPLDNPKYDVATFFLAKDELVLIEFA